jgi:hypothetical protein
MPTRYNPDTAQYRRPSLTTHNRLLPVPTSLAYERNLRAEIHDSLWMLSRQWQMGEFKGEDAGAPAFARVESSQVQPTLLSLDPKIAPDFYDVKKTPLEPLVEQEIVGITIFMRIQAGYHFRKLLKTKNLDKHYTAFSDAYPLPVTDLPTWDTEGLDLLKTVQGSLADGVLIIEDIETGRLKNFITAKFPADATALMEVAVALLNWLLKAYPSFAMPNNIDTRNPAKPRAWELDQLEYAFSLKVGDKELRSDNYTDGQLDWQDFTWSGSLDLPNAVKKTETFVPVSVRYQGMPRPRYWEMEEGRVNFGAISMSPTNSLSMAFSEFGLAYSNDWFWIPIPLTINTLCRIDKLEVTSVFGDKTIYAAQSTPNSDPLSIFSLFQLSNPDNNTAEPILYLPPTLPKVQEADTPLERVHFLRDEQSNLAWAIETIVPSMTQRGVQLPLSTPPKNEPTDAEGLIYRLGNVMPDNWTPFIPVRLRDKVGNITNETRLQRAQMPNQPLPNGQILKDTPPRRGGYLIREEEVSRIGTIIERSWQRSRWLNGKTFTWIGRRKVFGRMDVSSSLAWDFVVRE